MLKDEIADLENQRSVFLAEVVRVDEDIYQLKQQQTGLQIEYE